MDAKQSVELEYAVADARAMVAELLGWDGAIGWGIAATLVVYHFWETGWLSWSAGVATGLVFYLLTTRRYSRAADAAWNRLGRGVDWTSTQPGAGPPK
jgi:hypothetical protein